MPTGGEPHRRIVLDTSAYSWLRAGHAEVLDTLASADLVWVPSVVIGELEAGFRLGTRYRENIMLLEEFLAEPFVAVRPISREVASRYGRIFSELRRGGTPIPINDVWIAAATLDCGGTLLTFDRHFGAIVGLDASILQPPE
jgi:predicted nucleic acid-binding protein